MFNFPVQGGAHMKQLFTITLVAVIALACSPAAVFAQASGQPRVPTVTRLVKQFTDLENKLNASLSKKDAGALQALLDDDFEMRVGATPGDPVPRAEWLQSAQADTANLPGVGQMAVHDYGEIAVVSFLGSRAAGGGLFIIDVWKRAAGGWRLSTRYASPAGDATFEIPGVSADRPVFKKKI
jgi:hypothetical protein